MPAVKLLTNAYYLHLSLLLAAYPASIAAFLTSSHNQPILYVAERSKCNSQKCAITQLLPPVRQH